MIACRLRTFAKCQRPKSGDNTEEGWRGMEREPFGIRIHPHPHVHAYRMQNKPQDVRHSSRCFITGSLDPHFSLKPYILHALCALGLSNLAVFVCLFVCYFHDYAGSVYISAHLTKLTPLIWLTSTSLSANNQWLAVVWSLAIGFFDAQTRSCWQKAKNTIKDCVILYAYQQRDFICSVDWTKPWLEWFCLPPLLLLTEKHISSL